MWQAAVLAPAPSAGRFSTYDLAPGADAEAARARLHDVSLEGTVIGVGLPLVLALRARIAGLRAFPAISGPGVQFPSTQGALWAFSGGEQPGQALDRARALHRTLGEGFVLREDVAAFKYRDGRDLTGYVDGTANPEGEAAIGAAIVAGRGPGLDGSTFVAAQRYVHSLDRFAAMPERARDATIGRRFADNEEIGDAPQSAHVKRAEQESFDPPAFLVRRSMPWGDVREQGLYFVAYGESLERFERVLRRMAGETDGVVDALLGFTRAVSGGYYWCPPVAESGELDLSALS